MGSGVWQLLQQAITITRQFGIVFWNKLPSEQLLATANCALILEKVGHRLMLKFNFRSQLSTPGIVLPLLQE